MTWQKANLWEPWRRTESSKNWAIAFWSRTISCCAGFSVTWQNMRHSWPLPPKFAQSTAVVATAWNSPANFQLSSRGSTAASLKSWALACKSSLVLKVECMQKSCVFFFNIVREKSNCAQPFSKEEWSFVLWTLTLTRVPAYTLSATLHWSSAISCGGNLGRASC